MSGREFTEVDLVRRFERSLIRARRAAGRKFGRQFVRTRRARLGKVSSRRKKGVGYRIRKYDEGLFLFDMAPMAFAEEFGAVIKPEDAKELFVRTGDPVRPGEKAKRVGDYLFAGSGKDKRLVGFYETEVTVDRVQKSRRFYSQAEEIVDGYFEALEKAFDEATY